MLSDQPDSTPHFDRRAAAQEAADEAAINHYVPPEEEASSGGLGGVGGGDLEFRREDTEAYQMLLDSVSGQVEKLSRSIIQEYQTKTRRRSIASEAGRLDGRSLVRAYIGDPMVFRVKKHLELPQPAIAVVVDASLSMRGMKMRLAKQACAVLLETNEHLRVKTSLHMFGGSQALQVKGFEQPVLPARQKLVAVQAAGGTPMAEGLWEAGVALARRREQRKLLFLLSDGEANDPERTQEVADMLQASGIEMYGIGIISNAVENYCQHSHLLTDPAMIGEAILLAMKRSMLKVA